MEPGDSTWLSLYGLLPLPPPLLLLLLPGELAGEASRGGAEAGERELASPRRRPSSRATEVKLSSCFSTCRQTGKKAGRRN